MKGWISLHRSIMDKGYYKDSHYVHLWVHLLLEANHAPKEFMWNGSLITVERGQLITGRKQLAAETGINEYKVERIIKTLKSAQQIEQQTTTKYRLITIVNYDKYQVLNTTAHNKRTTNAQQMHTNNNNNNNNNNMKKNSFRYSENKHQDYEDSLDIDGDMEVVKEKKPQRLKQNLELLSWIDQQQGSAFVTNPARYSKTFKHMREKTRFEPHHFKARFKEMKKQDYWMSRSLSPESVLKNLEANPPKK